MHIPRAAGERGEREAKKGATIDSSRSSKHVVLCRRSCRLQRCRRPGRGPLQPKLPDLSKGTVARKPAKETVVVARRKRGDRTKLGMGHHHRHNPEDAEGVKVGELAEGPESQKWENM